MTAIDTQVDHTSCAEIPGRPELADQVARGRLAQWTGVRLGDHVKARWLQFRLHTDDGPYDIVHIDAGPPPKTDHVVPPAGEDHAFDREVWAHRVEVYVSPTGRSVRVYVDGQEFKPCD